nr:hypothetical protein [Tanacetum cinerariifolium]
MALRVAAEEAARGGDDEVAVDGDKRKTGWCVAVVVTRVAAG